MCRKVYLLSKNKNKILNQEKKRTRLPCYQQKIQRTAKLADIFWYIHEFHIRFMNLLLLKCILLFFLKRVR